MSLFLDILIVAILVFSIVRHYKLGFACSLLTFGKFILALILASIFRKPVAELVLQAFADSELPGGIVNMLSGIIAFVLIFVAVIAVSTIIIHMISKINIPLITGFDKFLGLALGIVLGLASVSIISTVAFSILELITSLDAGSQCMNVYSDSYVFKFIYDLKFFEFIRKLI